MGIEDTVKNALFEFNIKLEECYDEENDAG